MTFGGAFGGGWLSGYAHKPRRWWETPTLLTSDALVVYQPKGAVSEAASYADLSGHGNDATFTLNGVALTADQRATWTVGDGWQCSIRADGTSRVIGLPSNLYPRSNYSVFLSLRNVALQAYGNNARCFGARYSTGNRFTVWPCFSAKRYYGNGGNFSTTPAVTGTVDMFMSGTTFLATNGVRETGTMPTGFVGTIDVQMILGGYNTEAVVDWTLNGSDGLCDVWCFALWNRPLTWQEYVDVRTKAQALALL